MSAPAGAAAGIDPGLTDVVLAPMRWWDIEAVVELEGQLFPHDRWTTAQFWSELAGVPDSRFYVLARAGGELLGYAGLFANSDGAEVLTIAVAPSAQGRGVGRVLLRRLLSEAGSRGARRVALEVRADNEPALALYRGHGFEVDGRRRDYYGRGQDAILMSCRLAAGSAGDAGGTHA